MDSKQELLLCLAVEAGLAAQYRMKPELTDALCVIGLHDAIIAVKHKFGFASNEMVLSRPVIDDIVAHVANISAANVNIDGLSLNDYIAVVSNHAKLAGRSRTWRGKPMG